MFKELPQNQRQLLPAIKPGETREQWQRRYQKIRWRTFLLRLIYIEQKILESRKTNHD